MVRPRTLHTHPKRPAEGWRIPPADRECFISLCSSQTSARFPRALNLQVHTLVEVRRGGRRATWAFVANGNGARPSRVSICLDPGFDQFSLTGEKRLDNHVHPESIKRPENSWSLAHSPRFSYLAPARGAGIGFEFMPRPRQSRRRSPGKA